MSTTEYHRGTPSTSADMLIGQAQLLTERAWRLISNRVVSVKLQRIARQLRKLVIASAQAGGEQ